MQGRDLGRIDLGAGARELTRGLNAGKGGWHGGYLFGGGGALRRPQCRDKSLTRETSIPGAREPDQRLQCRQWRVARGLPVRRVAGLCGDLDAGARELTWIDLNIGKDGRAQGATCARRGESPLRHPDAGQLPSPPATTFPIFWAK